MTIYLKKIEFHLQNNTTILCESINNKSIKSYDIIVL